MSQNKLAKPIVKIAGGKTRMLPTLLEHLPKDFHKKEYTYVEPFLGGGSFGIYLTQTNLKINKVYFNEFNYDLFNLWNVVKSNLDSLIAELDVRKSKNSEEFFYNVRSNFIEYNLIKDEIDTHSLSFKINRAADFLYLNKTCFNGLIRYNKKGKFNSPYGKYPKPPAIYDEDNLKKISSILKKVSLTLGDFESSIKSLLNSNKLSENTLVYMDPPYIPESPTSNFVDYTYAGFNYSDHIRMRKLVDILTDRGIKVLISNSDTPMTREIYKGYKIRSVLNNRSIGARASTRGKTKELLIKNY